MLGESFVTPEQYNLIECLESQIHCDPIPHLERLGRIFVGHKAQRDHGISLLHRHDNLLPGHVMLYTRPCVEVITCKMEEVEYIEREAPDAVPCSFYLDSGRRFQSFEYARNLDHVYLHDQFLEEVADYLTRHNLSRVFGIAQIWPDFATGRWVETLRHEARGIVGHLHLETQPAESGIVTEWRFVESTGTIIPMATKECITTKEGGGHIIKK